MANERCDLADYLVKELLCGRVEYDPSDSRGAEFDILDIRGEIANEQIREILVKYNKKKGFVQDDKDEFVFSRREKPSDLIIYHWTRPINSKLKFTVTVA